ncbi:hypothetical protein BGZ96_007701 [Linnemannia gamsii]|uniref:FYR N-terminal domain-containing protein n=1 Tax=Linnemannia gamsii TaxID=64522 RepID=A0ABQ7K0L0_9FUNG|nr:hypothetical protein BGZ96_007701 [Linnemannia gamsii]
MEGVISISTATASPTPTSTVNGHHNHNHHHDEKKYNLDNERRRQPSSPTLAKNGQHKKALFSSETGYNSNIKKGKHSTHDIRIHSPSPSPSPKKSKNTNGTTATTRFNLTHDDHDESEDQHDEDNHGYEHDQDDHESHLSGMDLDPHDHHDDDHGHHFSEYKYKSLKRKLKLAHEDNERMSHELDKFHRRVRHLRREKNLLLDRLCTMQRQGSDSGSDSISSLSSDSESSDSSLSDESPRAAQRAGGSKQGPGSGKGSANMSGRGSGPSQAAANASHSAATTSTGAIASSSKKKGGVRRSSPSAAGTSTPISNRSGPKEPKPQTPAAIPSTITNVGSATQKPKRVHQTNKQRPGLAKARKVQIVERDDQGNVKLPVTVGIITILNIGYVVYDREAFHNDRYIWPVGYKMSRSYNSMVDPTTHTTYTCSVIDDGEAPKFQIDAEDQPGKPIIAGTATGAWTHIVKAANAIRKRDHSNSASGPDYFGFSNATIAKMIQDLPDAEKCSTYVMQQFEEIAGSGGSALAGTPGGAGGASQSSGGGGVTGKRKVSAMASGAKSGKDRNDDDQDAADGDAGTAGGNDGEDDDEEYASLGSLSKPSNPKSANVALNIKQKKTKKTKLSAAAVAVPAIRLAGVNDFAPGNSNPPPPTLSSIGSLLSKEKTNDVLDGGEETISESGSPQSGNQQVQSNGTSAKASAAKHLVNQDVDVDVDVVDVDDDGDEVMHDGPHQTLSVAEANGSEARHDDDECITTDEDTSLHTA